MNSSESLERISAIKRKVNEIGLTPLEEHGVKFADVNEELSEALAKVEGISTGN